MIKLIRSSYLLCVYLFVNKLKNILLALNKLLNMKHYCVTSSMLIIYFYQEKTFELSNYIISSQTCLSE